MSTPIEIEAEVTEEEYRDFLDEAYPDANICGSEYSPGRALQEVDPTAFRCEKNGYEDSLDNKWKCAVCDTEYDDEEEAEHCCMHECEECGEWYDDEGSAKRCCEPNDLGI